MSTEKPENKDEAAASSGQAERQVIGVDELKTTLVELTKLRDDIYDCIQDNTWELQFYDKENFKRELLELLTKYRLSQTRRL